MVGSVMIIHIFLFFFGLTAGSFLNVLIYRWPRGEPVVFSRSYCPSCGHKLGWKDLFPVASFFWLQGRCRYCGRPISRRYPVVELLGGLMTVLWGTKFHGIDGSPVLLLLTYTLLGIAFIDLEHKIIPNRLTIPLLLAGLVLKAWTGELTAAIIGGITGGGILFLVTVLYPKGMGMGDVKLLAMLGVYLGWEKVLFVLFFASFLALVIVSILILLKRITRKDPIPFGTFLSIAALSILYFPDMVILGRGLFVV